MIPFRIPLAKAVLPISATNVLFRGPKSSRQEIRGLIRLSEWTSDSLGLMAGDARFVPWGSETLACFIL
jgi:hypothetical protein